MKNSSYNLSYVPNNSNTNVNNHNPGLHKSTSLSQVSESSLSSASTTSDTFVIIKYGNNEDCIFNTNCKVQILMDDIKLRCHVNDKEKIIDLSDLNGNLVNIRDESLKNKYATLILKPRQTLVLIEVKSSLIEPHFTTYVPLLDNKDIVNDAFMLRLLPKLPQQKKSGNKTGGLRSGSRNSVVSINVPNNLLENSKLRSGISHKESTINESPQSRRKSIHVSSFERKKMFS